MNKEYSNGEITVKWQPKLCQHAGVCVKTLPEVYNPKASPWIAIENASTEALKDQVSKCPSGALSYFINNETKFMSKPNIAEKKPKKVELEKGMVKSWCSCGLSNNQPFCDGLHRTTSFRPLKFEAEETGDAFLCMCKQTKNPPYCDGSHSKLEES